MSYNSYIKCIEAKLPSTGELQIFYDFSSGEKNVLNTSADLLYNLRYPTGESVKQVTIGGTQTGVIESSLYPGFSIGQTDMPVTHNGYFSGVDLVKVGLTVDYDGWSAALDMTPDLCDYTDQNNLSRVLFSTMDSHDSTSGFYLGINQAGRLYLQCNNGGTHPAITLNSEINKNSVVGVSQFGDTLTAGVINLETRVVDQESLVVDGYAASNKMYLGGFLSNTNIDYTGYEGTINNFALFNENYEEGELYSMGECMFVTGVEVTSTTSEIVSPNITGYREETIYATGVTGYVEQYKTITDGDGNNFLTTYQSGVTGLISGLGTQVVFLTGAPTVASNTFTTSGIIHEQSKIDLYNRYYLNFKNGLESGEHIEILSFSSPRPDIGLEPNADGQVSHSTGLRLYNYGLYKQSSGDFSLDINGFIPQSETILPVTTTRGGHDYDYYVLEDQTITGFVTDEQEVIYDVVGDTAICIDYSGWWGESPLGLMPEGFAPNKVATGYGSSAGNFPERPQFFNEKNTVQEPWRDKGQVIITGISGQKIWRDHHIYYNGQKLIENIDYFEQPHTYINGGNNYTVDALVITGGLPGVAIYGNSYSSIIGSPDGFYTPEMCFVPIVLGEQPQEILKNITGDTYGIPDPLSGFSEMIWLNGVRQKRDISYRLGKECSLTRSFTLFGENPFIFYNNSEGFLNYS